MQYSENRCDKISILPFFLVGMAAGVGLTLLLAPISGPDTRKLIARKSKEAGDWVSDKASELKGSAENARESLQSRAQNFADAIHHG